MDLEGFDQFEAMFRSAFSNQQHAIEDLVGEGDAVAVRLRFEGVQTGDFMGVPASGKHFSVEGTAFLRIADGKVAQLWAFSTRWPYCSRSADCQRRDAAAGCGACGPGLVPTLARTDRAPRANPWKDASSEPGRSA